MAERQTVFGGEEIQSEILKLLKLNSFSYEHLTHHEVSPNKVAREIGVSLCEGVKCLILRGKKSEKSCLFCLLGHQKVDMRAVAELVDENCEFENLDRLQEKFGLSVGAVPPFGYLLGMDVYFDRTIDGCKEVIFSSGVPHGSIRMKRDDLVLLIKPQFAIFAKVI